MRTRPNGSRTSDTPHWGFPPLPSAGDPATVGAAHTNLTLAPVYLPGMRIDLRAPLTFLISGLAFMACSGGLPFPGLTTMEVYNIGVQAMQEERWGAAAEAFQNVLLTSGFEFAAEARLQLARSEYEREHYRIPVGVSADARPLPGRHYGAPRGLGHLPLVGRAVAHPPSRPVVHPAGPDELPTDGVRLRRNAHRPPSLGGRLGDARQARRAGLHHGAPLSEEKSSGLGHPLLRGGRGELPESSWAPWALLKKIEAFEKIGYRQDVEETREKLLELYVGLRARQATREWSRVAEHAPAGSGSSGARSTPPTSATSP